MSAVLAEQQPDFSAGVQYWANLDATVNTVLGGYGPTTSVPRLDAASSRTLLLSLFPSLSTIVPPHRRTPSRPSTTVKAKRPFRALDCGAGVGRVTSDVLLPLFHQVDLVEPVEKFLVAAQESARKQKDGGWKLLAKDTEAKGVRMWLGGLQYFDPSVPAVPLGGGTVKLVATEGATSLVWPDAKKKPEEGEGYDLVMVQWCIGHLSDEELVAFLKRAHAALRRTETGLEGYIVLKENTCKDDADDGKGRLWDADDSSWTRSDAGFRSIFKDAGLNLIRREVQAGFPPELFPVISYVLR